MQYYDGQDIKLGDRVSFDNKMGRVALVGNEADGRYGFKRSEWDIAEAAIFIVFDNGALFELDETEQDDLLVLRGRETGSEGSPTNGSDQDCRDK